MDSDLEFSITTVRRSQAPPPVQLQQRHLCFQLHLDDDVINDMSSCRFCKYATEKLSTDLQCIWRWRYNVAGRWEGQINSILGLISKGGVECPTRMPGVEDRLSTTCRIVRHIYTRNAIPLLASLPCRATTTMRQLTSPTRAEGLYA